MLGPVPESKLLNIAGAALHTDQKPLMTSNNIVKALEGCVLISKILILILINILIVINSISDGKFVVAERQHCGTVSR